jgi:hypothetical protein
MSSIVDNLLKQRGDTEAFRARVRRLSGLDFQEAVSLILHELGEESGEAYLELCRLMGEMVRHYELLRAGVTTGVLAAAAIVLAIVETGRLEESRIAVSVALIAIGAFATVFAWRLTDAVNFHASMVLVWRKAFLRTLKSGHADFLWTVSSARFNRVGRIAGVFNHEALWIGVNALPILAGILLWTGAIGPATSHFPLPLNLK